MSPNASTTSGNSAPGSRNSISSVSAGSFLLYRGFSAQLELKVVKGDFRAWPKQDRAVALPADVASFNEAYRDLHFHTDPEVRYIDSGSGAFTVRVGPDDQVWPVAAGDFIYIQTGCIHRFQSGPEGFAALRFFSKAEGGGEQHKETK